MLYMGIMVIFPSDWLFPETYILILMRYGMKQVMMI